MSVRARWDAWWFTPADPRAYAALRIGYGLLGLWLYVPLAGQLDALLGDPGVYPLAARAQDYGPERLSLLANPLWEVGSSLGVRVFFAFLVVAFAATAVGAASRLAQAAAWIAVVSMLNRTAVWSDGSDVLLKVFGFYLLLMPLGRVWSLDALRRPDPRPVPGWPLRLFQLQVCILYVKTGLVKAIDGRWQDGVAIYHALSTSYFWRFHMEPFLGNPVFQAFTVAATYATLAFEIGFPLVFVARLRRTWLLVGLGLHLGVAVFMNLGGFSEAILWTYLAFVTFPPRRVGTGP